MMTFDTTVVKVLFSDFVWRVCWRTSILVINFVLIWWQTDKRQVHHEASGPVYLHKTANCLIIGSNNIFKIEINCALVILVIMHNLQTQNQNRLKFQIQILTWIFTYWQYRKMMLKSGNRPLNQAFYSFLFHFINSLFQVRLSPLKAKVVHHLLVNKV